MEEFLKLEYFDNSVLRWFIAFFTGLLIGITLFVTKKILISRFANVQNNETAVMISELAQKTKGFFFFAVSVFFALNLVNFPEKIHVFFQSISTIGILLQSGFWGDTAIKNWSKKSIFVPDRENPTVTTVVNLTSFFLKFSLWLIIIILALDNLGFNISTLIAGVGVGGLAVSLAAQNILKDLFASISIVIDKPFLTGDLIVIGDFSGTVENIGLKTTRIRSISGEQIIFSNTDLLESRVRNFKRMAERRILFNLGVVYNTKKELLEKIPSIVKESIENTEKTRFDLCCFKNFASNSLNFEVIFFVLDSDYKVAAEIQEKINLAIYSRFRDEGIEFAYAPTTPSPTQEATKTPNSGKENNK